MNLFHRHILGQILFGSLIFSVILAFIPAQSLTVELLEKLANGSITWKVWLGVTLLEYPVLLRHVSPLAIAMALPWALGGVWFRKEMLAARFAGISPGRTQALLMLVGFIVAVAHLWFSLGFVPKAEQWRQKLETSNQIQGLIASITPGEFFYIDQGAWLAVSSISSLKVDQEQDFQLLKAKQVYLFREKPDSVDNTTTHQLLYADDLLVKYCQDACESSLEFSGVKWSHLPNDHEPLSTPGFSKPPIWSIQADEWVLKLDGSDEKPVLQGRSADDISEHLLESIGTAFAIGLMFALALVVSSFASQRNAYAAIWPMFMVALCLIVPVHIITDWLEEINLIASVNKWIIVMAMLSIQFALSAVIYSIFSSRPESL